MTRFILLILLVFAAACSKGQCTKTPENKPEPVPTPALTATAPPEVPAFPEVDWMPFDEDTQTHIDTTGQCVFVYFGDGCDDCLMMEFSFLDERIVKLINDAFVAIRYPVSPENDMYMTEVLGIDVLPTSWIIYSKNEYGSVIAEGYLSPAQLEKFLLHGDGLEIETLLAKGSALYKECKRIKDQSQLDK